jgi:hypothetical protein
MHRIRQSRNYTSKFVINEGEKTEQAVIDFFFKLDSEETVEIEWQTIGGVFSVIPLKKQKLLNWLLE